LLPSTSDYLVWYARDLSRVKFRQLFIDKSYEAGTADTYRWLRLSDGSHRGMTGISEGFEYLNRVACGLIAAEPEWFVEPALFVISLTHPADLDTIAGIKNRRNPLRPWSRVAIGVPVHRTAQWTADRADRAVVRGCGSSRA
jgi:hypothetical protein